MLFHFLGDILPFSATNAELYQLHGLTIDQFVMGIERWLLGDV